MNNTFDEHDISFVEPYVRGKDQRIFLGVPLSDEGLVALCDNLKEAACAEKITVGAAGLIGGACYVPDHDLGLFTYGVSDRIIPGPKVTIVSPERDLTEILPKTRCSALACVAMMDGIGGAKEAIDVSVLSGIEAFGGPSGLAERLAEEPEVISAKERNGSFFRNLVEVEMKPGVMGSFGNPSANLAFLVRVGIWPYSREAR